ncbi:MAG: outer membrane protein assembly factor BamD [Candidatus Omnitrophota bacterium]
MIKKYIFAITLFSLLSISVFYGLADAYWIWTPETKKFTNPKYAVKDSPKEQFDWAMSFYDAKDFQRAATEFEKLAKQYEFSEYASKSQYYVGLCYENMNKYYLAYQNYQKAIDNFPHIANTEEILAREFAIANLYLSKPGPKVLGTDIMAPLDRAVEIFKKIVENAPYGKFSEEAQFKLGEALKKSERYEEAVQAFHKIVEDYPKSKLVTQAMYEESNCAYKASLRPAYDAAATDNAIKTFEKFVRKNKDTDLAKNATATMQRLKDNVAEKSFKAAEFYESQGKIAAAIIYYQDVIDTYPDSSFVSKARDKIEALKTRGTKKAAASIDPGKKKSESEQVVRQKKPWRVFKFGKSEKPEVKSETVVSETPKKKSWNPFSFKIGKKKSSEAARTETVQAPETPPKKRPWNLFNLGVKKEPAAKKAPKKKTWKPFTFDTAKKKEDLKKAPEAPAVQAKETEAAAFAEKTPDVETPAQPAETPVAETLESEEVQSTETQIQEEAAPQIQEEPKSKAWKPFNFDTKKEPVVKETGKNKGWKPLYFGTNDEPMAATNRRW